MQEKTKEKHSVFFARVPKKTLEKIRLQKAKLKLESNEDWINYSLENNR